ncbi:MAG: hypothetical protein HZC41_19905 [Chloroflexi bacterium]|nr:hypothetical protein [Chloroflexota bacterium]
MDSELIYRAFATRGAKELSLHRVRDWKTGLSFLNYEYGADCIVFESSILRNAGYVVEFDSQQIVKELPFFGGNDYIEPNADERIRFPEGHCTVYHPDQQYWDAWHQADLANLHVPKISEYLQRFYDLRVRS